MKSSILSALGLVAGCTGPSSGPSVSGFSGEDGVLEEGPEATTDFSDDDEGEDEGVRTTGSVATSSEDDGRMFDDCNGEDIVQLGYELSAGFERCADGRVRRVKVSTCMAPVRAENPQCGQDEFDGCSPGSCNEAPFGACVSGFDTGCYCSYSGCSTDADCEEGTICACAADGPDLPSFSQCIPALCRSDADCGGFGCELAYANDGCGPSFVMACRTPYDECVSAADCPPEQGFDGCSPSYYSEDGVWRCVPQGCAIGRPFYVDDHLRTAHVITREDWCEGFRLPEEDAGLLAEVRERLARHYETTAALEHASVASFSRFAMQLLMLGAPADLLEDTTRAMADEIRHARLAFGLAARFAGRSLGPGPLDVAGSIVSDYVDLEAILKSVISEACVGETLSAVEAAAARTGTTDPQAREALTAIADDELRHAQLGWKALRWGLDRGDTAMRGRLLAHLRVCVERAWTERPLAERHPHREALLAHGMLDDAGRRRAIELGVLEVVGPSAAALERHYGGDTTESPVSRGASDARA